MAATITDVGGTITITGNLEVRDEVIVEDSLTVGENLLVSGDLHIDDAITESTNTGNYLTLEIRNVPLDTATNCYTVTPIKLDVVAAAVTLIQIPTADTAFVYLEYGGVAPAQLCTAFDDADPVGATKYDDSLGVTDTLTADTAIYVYSNAGAVAGIVNVYLICKQTT